MVVVRLAYTVRRYTTHLGYSQGACYARRGISLSTARDTATQLDGYAVSYE